MPNIPFIHHNRNAGATQIRRTQQAFESAESRSSPSIKRRLDRRTNKERRQKQVAVNFNRRQCGIHRRNSTSAHTKPADIGVTIGNHINTSA